MNDTREEFKYHAEPFDEWLAKHPAATQRALFAAGAAYGVDQTRGEIYFKIHRWKEEAEDWPARLDAYILDRLWTDSILDQLFPSTATASACCAWTETEEYWSTECGGAFCITTGTPTENEMRFCPYCGSPIDQRRAGGAPCVTEAEE